jgi:hypothetical protein
VPSGIATDDTTQLFFADLMESQSLASLYDFENREGLFPEVDSRMKFCLLTMRESGQAKSATADFVFFALNVENLCEEQRHFTLTAADLALLNPNTRTCPIFRSKRDAELTKAIYFCTSSSRGTANSKMPFKLGTLLHSSADAGKFEDAEVFLQLGWCLDELGRFTDGQNHALPLFHYRTLFTSQLKHRKPQEWHGLRSTSGPAVAGRVGTD